MHLWSYCQVAMYGDEYKSLISSKGKAGVRPFTPPCGCTRQQFIWAVGGITVAVVVLAALIVTLVMIFGCVQPFKFPEAEPWWTHGLVYQIHVPTFANDAGGSLGRLKDVSSRMVYLADK
ncbi:hypothetical protein ACTXT7_012618, partial [Hymenolepis weldensis]